MPDPSDQIAVAAVREGAPALPDADAADADRAAANVAATDGAADVGPGRAAAGGDESALPAGAAERAAPARQQVAERAAAHRSRRRVSLRTSVTLGLFAIGVLVGASAWRLLTPPVVPADSYPALAQSGEPAAAALVVSHLRANDARALGESLDQETLTAIRNQLSPLTIVDRVDFSSATSLGQQTLAAYVVEGRDPQGSRGIVGLILILRDGVVVAE